MLCKLSLLAVVAPLVSAITLDVPANPTSGGTVTIKWGSAPDDPATFSLELINTVFNNAFAISNDVNPTAGEITLTLPVVPVGDGYTLEAVNIGNITDVFSTSGTFSIGAASASVTSASSTSAGSSSKSSGTGSATTSSTVTTPLSSTSGVTSNIVTPPQTSPTTSSSGNSSTVSTTPFAGALSSRLDLGGFVGGMAAIVLSAVAGAAMIAF